MIELSQWKELGNCKLFVVTGCLAERYAEQLAVEMPEADIIIGTGDFPKITEYIHKAFKGEKLFVTAMPIMKYPKAYQGY